MGEQDRDDGMRLWRTMVHRKAYPACREEQLTVDVWRMVCPRYPIVQRPGSSHRPCVYKKVGMVAVSSPEGVIMNRRPTPENKDELSTEGLRAPPAT